MRPKSADTMLGASTGLGLPSRSGSAHGGSRQVALTRLLALAAAGTVLLTSAAAQCRMFSSDRTDRQAPVEPRLDRLTRGINVSHWFAQGPIRPDHLRDYITAEDARRLRGLGFRHVRLNVNPDVLLDRSSPDVLTARHLALLDSAIDLFLAHDLAVIVNLHPFDEFKRRLAVEPEFASVVARFWRALARHLSMRDPAMVLLEVLNEPTINDPARWTAIQQQLLAAMRQGAPSHTLIATGDGVSTVDDLVALTPVPDPNVLYSFHLYEPAIFTHQGADWGLEIWGQVRDLPYPSSPSAVAAVLPRIPERARGTVHAYGEERWDVGRLARVVTPGLAWARQHNVRLTCTEFGVYRPVAPAEDRTAWIRDARMLLDQNGVGWTAWDYVGGFGVATERDGQRVADTATILALGLHDRLPREGTAQP